MKNIFNKTNAPYLAIGTLATLTFLASGVFAVAPYAQFLAPVAALSVGLPFIIGGAVFSVIIIALSYKAISKNKTISEKDAQLSEKEKEIEELKRGNAFVPQAKDIKEVFTSVAEAYNSGRIPDIVKRRCSDVANDLKNIVGSAKNAYGTSVESMKGALGSVGNKLKNVYDTMPSTEFAKDIQIASEKAFTSTKEAFISGRVTRIVKDGLKDVYGAMPSTESAKRALGSVGSGVKNAYDISIESAKEKLSNASDAVGSGVKSVCNAMPSTESARNRVPSLKTVGWIAGGTVLLTGATYIAANGGLGVAGNSSNAVGNSTNSTESGVSIPNSSSVCYRPTYQQIMQIQIDEASKKLADAEKFAENNFGMSEEDNTNNKNESQSVVSRILSIPRNLWGSISNLISGSNKDAHNHSEPQWSKDLHKSEDLEEIIDGGTLDNLFSPRVNNGINTSRQQSTLMDSVDLTKLTREVHPSAYSNSLPGVF